VTRGRAERFDAHQIAATGQDRTTSGVRDVIEWTSEIDLPLNDAVAAEQVHGPEGSRAASGAPPQHDASTLLSNRSVVGRSPGRAQ
jgi:hypothetical protein